MTVREKIDSAFDSLKGEFGYTNKMAAPKILKVVVSTGTGGLMKKDRNKNDFIVMQLSIEITQVF
jgi:ribosomal protein L5